MTDRRDEIARLRCPRCGYDQRGESSTWTHACPLESRCTECGLRIEWAELLSPKRERPRWCVEFATRWYHVPWRTVRTLFVMLRPWRFWSDLKMSYEPRWGRLAGAGACLLFLAYLCLAVTQGRAVWIDRTEYDPRLSRAAYSAVYAAVLPWSSAPPALYHGAVTGLVPYPPPPSAYAERFAWGTVRWTDIKWSMVTGDIKGSQIKSSFGSALVFFGPGLIPLITTPLGFLLLPVSRRRAKVRWSHIARITVYSLALVPILLGYVIAHYSIVYQGSWGRVAEPLYHQGWHLMVWGVPALLFAWWAFAIGRYLRMPHAAAVAAAIVVIGVLLGPAFLLVVWSLGDLL